MEFRPITDYAQFHHLLTEYYRDGADADTPQEAIDGVIRYLFDLYAQDDISGCIAWEGEPVGFALWQLDTPDSPFSQKPGWGTILEIGLTPKFRGRGYGSALVCHAENAVQAQNRYVCAYGPAEGFWKKCGYRDSGELATNGLKLFIK